MKKVHLLSLLIFFSCTFVFSQNTAANPPKKKEHYKLILNGDEDPLWYEKAMTKAEIDTLRFLNTRRQIPFKGTKIILELFSAQELFDLYGKPISRFTIKDPAKARKIKLYLNNGVVAVTE